MVEDSLLIGHMGDSLLLESITIMGHVWERRRGCETIGCSVLIRNVGSVEVLVGTAIADFLLCVSIEVVVVYLYIMLMLLLHHAFAIALVFMSIRLHHELLILEGIVMVMRWGHAFTWDSINDPFFKCLLSCADSSRGVRLTL